MKACVCRHRSFVKYLLYLLLVSIAGGLAVNKMGPHPDHTHPLADPNLMFVGFVISLGLIQPATVTLLVVYLASAEKQKILPKKAANVGKAVVLWLADYTYDIFLLHPLVYMAVLNALPPSIWFEKAVGSPYVFFAIGALTFIVSLVAAILHKRTWARILNGVWGVQY
jgi:peptidoglycan/LPS O-acetylase OafA/YrhL